jgi:hypothetical protein
MDRSQPSSNKLCSGRIDRLNLDSHRARMKNIKAQVDTKEPFANKCDHIRNNLKKEQQMEERYSEIDRTNRILLKKMSDIMRAPTVLDQDSRGPKSMNREFRKRELMRITKDNQYILRRIQNAQPALNHTQWEVDHQKQTEYLKRKIEFPLVIRTPRKAPLSARLAPVAPRGEAIEAPLTERSHRPIPPKPQNLEMVYHAISNLDNVPYALEMSKDDRGTLYVTAHDDSTNTTLELMVGVKLHRQLYKESYGDYALIAERLRIEAGHRLVLDDGPPMNPPPLPLAAPMPEPSSFKPAFPPGLAALENGGTSPKKATKAASGPSSGRPAAEKDDEGKRKKQQRLEKLKSVLEQERLRREHKKVVDEQRMREKIEKEKTMEGERKMRQEQIAVMEELEGRGMAEAIKQTSIITEDQFMSSIEDFKSAWDRVHQTPFHSLLKSLRTPTMNSHRNLGALHLMWERMVEGKGDYTNGSALLLAKLYTMEAKDVDMLVGFPKQAQGSHNAPAPYKTMNAAARLLSGEQDTNPEPPKTAAEAQEPFERWVKLMGCLSCTTLDLHDASGIDQAVESLKLLARDPTSGGRRVASGNHISNDCMNASIGSLRFGLAAWRELWPELQTLASDGEMTAPCFFSGLGLEPVSAEIMSKLKAFKKGDPFYSCSLRSMSLHLPVAMGFMDSLDNRGDHNVLFAIEGVREIIPMWSISAYQGEIEAVLPCFTRLELVCDPVECCSFQGHQFKQRFLFIRLRYQSSGFDQEFTSKIRDEVRKDDEELARMSQESLRRRAGLELLDASLSGDRSRLFEAIQVARRTQVNGADIQKAEEVLKEEDSKIHAAKVLSEAMRRSEASGDHLDDLSDAIVGARLALVSAAETDAAEKLLERLEDQGAKGARNDKEKSEEVCRPADEWDADRLMKKGSVGNDTAEVEIKPSAEVEKVRGLSSAGQSGSAAVVEYQGPEKPVFTFAHRGRNDDSEEEFDRKMDVHRVSGNTAETDVMDLRAEIDMGGTEGDLMFRIRGLTPDSAGSPGVIHTSLGSGFGIEVPQKAARSHSEGRK